MNSYKLNIKIINSYQSIPHILWPLIYVIHFTADVKSEFPLKYPIALERIGIIWKV